MKKRVVFSCSCFIDQSTWFINSISCPQRFDEFVYANDSPSGDVFIYEKLSICDTVEIIVCCLECFEFLLTLFSIDDEFIDLLNKIDCLYVIEEPFCYNSWIYIGNDLFIFNGESNNGNDGNGNENDFKSTKDILEKYFKKFPNEKSCFTSMEKFSYKSFCFSCNEIFKALFLKKLIYFEK